ncbi:MAG TPA: hypothetical protein VMJ34_06150 [Bryobacteraceae bacterium]|nr:hypothetical protein [Bryobacteraceae bacterium]
MAVAIAAAITPYAQVIDFESGGLHYRTLTRNGLTIMFASLPSHVRNYSVMQVAVSNGSNGAMTVKPEDFVFNRPDGVAIQAAPAGEVVDSLMAKASRSDVIHLITAYETAIYGNSRLKSTNGYEARRQNALAEMGSKTLKAAAAASAIAMVSTKLYPGDSTDGAIFFPNAGKPLPAGKLTVRAGGELFEFDTDAAPAK